ncbi:MAG: hypothetical protein L6R36_006093 [Xanthoria steineri]|nr:MAG: hypothetical protein L6R36_006093 [Xanthoria steineri]
MARRGCKSMVMYPHWDPLLGMDLLYLTLKSIRDHNFLDRYADRFRRFGKSFGFFYLSSRFFGTSDPENVQAILSTSSASFEHGSRRRNAMAPLMGRGIFASDGEQWRHSRAMLRPSFTKYQMRGIVMPEDHFQNLLALLPENEEEVVDLQDLFHKFTMDTATELLLGQSVGSLCLTKSGTFDTFSHSFKVASEAVITAVRLGPLARILTSAKVVRARKEVHTFVERFIDETLEAHDQGTDGELKDSNDESNGGRYNFLHELVTVTSDRQVILDEVISALFAGRDTTACLLSNLFFCVARDRKVWRKLRDEVCQLPTDYNQADLASLKYTNMCIKESLRLHPPVPLNTRCPKEDVVLPKGGGTAGQDQVLLPADTIVILNMFALHRSRDIYGMDADKFRPERWEDQKPEWAYVPFGAGPRACLGRQLALAEATYVVVRMAQEFGNVTAAEDVDWEEQATMTLCVKHGCNVRLTRWKTDEGTT